MTYHLVGVRSPRRLNDKRVPPKILFSGTQEECLVHARAADPGAMLNFHGRAGRGLRVVDVVDRAGGGHPMNDELSNAEPAAAGDNKPAAQPKKVKSRKAAAARKATAAETKPNKKAAKK